MADDDTTATENATYANWKASMRAQPPAGVVEARLYTDVALTGELSALGPYSFLNTIAQAGLHGPTALRPGVVLRIALHDRNRAPAIPMKDDFDHYHGGDFVDELAAVASLFLGMRVKAGSVDREFRPDGDPLGRPIEYGWKVKPELPPAARSPQIPRLGGSRSLNDLQSFDTFPARTAREANTLIKAARLYQQAIWVCDADPALAWLQLISAVETAAVTWASDDGEPRERLRASLPQLYELLESSACPNLIDPIAKILAKYTQATKKFIDFLVAFSPGPPVERPAKAFCFKFNRKNLKDAAGVIYGHRSEALHSGTTIPMPMCLPPRTLPSETKEDTGPQEIPLGLAASSYGAAWTLAQTPMLLHLFEHLARGALLGWWKSSNQPA